jgi:glutamate 5-kinase
MVLVLDPHGDAIARGLVNYSSDEALKIIGLASGSIESTLGYVAESELMHRDNLVLL